MFFTVLFHQVQLWFLFPLLAVRNRLSLFPMTSQAVQQQLSKKEIEDLLRRGAYGAIMDEEDEGAKFCEEDIDQILQRRTKTITIESEGRGSTFAKASEKLNWSDTRFLQLKLYINAHQSSVVSGSLMHIDAVYT